MEGEKEGAVPEETVAVSGTSLDTAIIFTSNMQELAGFYQRGLQLGQYQSSPQHLGQMVGQVYLGFDQIEAADQGSRKAVTLWFTVDDLQSTFDRLVDMGAKVGYPPTAKPWGAVLACVYDPDGNLVGLAQRQTARGGSV
jgi:predicted enzyme related to lactoylglutathione lyase